MRKLVLAVALLILALPAYAAQRAYHRKPPDKANGIYNGLQRSPQITPSVQATGAQTGPTGSFGSYFLEDDALGTVTMAGYINGSTGLQPTTLNTTGFMMSPPGGYLYVRNAGTSTFPGGQAAPGNSDPSNQVDWGVLTGFSGTGDDFCRSTPPFICTFIQRLEDGSVPNPVNSSSYDLGTWVFDGAGDFEGTPYILGTQDGGVSNTVVFDRATFRGASLPALPLIGFAALAGALGVAGTRVMLRKK